MRTLPALLMGGLLLSGCVISTDESASPVDSVPADLFPTTVPSTTTTEPEDDVPAFELALYWHLQGADGARTLTEIIRRREQPATEVEALALLVEGPSQPEETDFVERELGALVQVVTEAFLPQIIAVTDGVAQVQVADEGGLRANESLIIPFAEELVCTLTGFAHINGVIIVDSAGQVPLIGRGSEPIPVPQAAVRENYDCVPPEPVDEPETTTDDES